MAFLIKRQLNEEEQRVVIGRFGRKCFATGHPIPEGEQIQFDHINAFALGGESELNNIAPMCAQHNKEKGVLSLEDFRIKLSLKDFFSRGDKLTLRDFLSYAKEQRIIDDFGGRVSIEIYDDSRSVTVESYSKKYYGMLCECPKTGWKYFYST